jgi:hypothetical protein
MKCSICKRNFKGKEYSWCNQLVGIQNLKCICQECDLSVSEQIINLIEEMKI